MWNTEKNGSDNATSTDNNIIRFIGDAAFDFHYEAMGQNGRISGVGKCST